MPSKTDPNAIALLGAGNAVHSKGRDQITLAGIFWLD